LDAGVELDAGVDPGQIENDPFNPMLVDWTSMPKSPGLQDADHGFDGFFLGDGDLGLSEDFLRNTTASNGVLYPSTRNGPITYDQNAPPFTELPATCNKNGSVPTESDLPGLDQRTLSTHSSIGPSQSSRNTPAETDSKSHPTPIFTSARSGPVSITRQLAKFVATLAEHASTIPPMSIHDDQHICKSSTGADENESSDLYGRTPRCIKCYGDGVFSIEETFQHTETMVNIYPRFITTIIQFEGPRQWWRMYLPASPATSPKAPAAQEQLSQNGHVSSSSGNSSVGNSPSNPDSTENHKATSRPPLDHASIYLLLSCHNRLIDIWETVFGHLKVRTDKDFAAGRTTDIDGRCAKIKIGSYAPSAASTTSMYMTLIMELSERLLEQSKQLVAEVSSQNTERNGDDHAGFGVAETSQNIVRAQHEAMVMACRATTDRASGMLEQICRIRQLTLSISQSTTASTS
jgi:hypothetical protein